MKTHELKIRPVFFRAVSAGKKKSEFRINDRDYMVGDILKLRECYPDEHYTGQFVFVRITYITPLTEWAPGYLMLSFELGPWKS